MSKRAYWSVVAVILVVLAAGYFLLAGQDEDEADIRIVISPYQDLAMLVNLKDLGLEEKYGTTVHIITIPWEEMYTTMLSASQPADVGFASFADYLTKASNLNKGSDDPLLFIYPAYIFKGGAFVSFKDDMVSISKETASDPTTLKAFLGRRLGLPKNTLYQMIVYDLAHRAGIDPKAVDFVDVGFDGGLLAAQAGDLDAAAVGLTQLTEARKQGGRVVLDMNSMKFSDVTGFIAKRSVIENKREHVLNVIRMWFDSVDYVLSDLDTNSSNSLTYLKKHAATQYTLESYKAALSHEYFPRTVEELESQLLSSSGAYPVKSIYEVMSAFLVAQGVVSDVPEFPEFLELR